MKATGIVRRVDELGRLVIPKEIRRTMRLAEGTPLEIFTDREGQIILKKYSPMMELGNFAKQYAESVAQTMNQKVAVSDRDQIIAVAGASKKDLLGKAIGQAAEKVMEDRRAVNVGDTAIHSLFRGNTDSGIEKTFSAQVMAPIIAEGDPIGTVIIATKDSNVKMTDLEMKLAETAASFLAKQMEQ